MFELCEPLCLVDSISVKFYQALHHVGTPVYPSKQIRFSFGFQLSSSGVCLSQSVLISAVVCLQWPTVFPSRHFPLRNAERSYEGFAKKIHECVA